VLLSEPHSIITGTTAHIQGFAGLFRCSGHSLNKIEIRFADIPGDISGFASFFETVFFGHITFHKWFQNLRSDSRSWQNSCLDQSYAFFRKIQCRIQGGIENPFDQSLISDNPIPMGKTLFYRNLIGSS